ncbi:hypothetical protein SAICODRAFT_29781 [Saitoella complicata NRRL Y-17804]|uniref:Uncharacterized protein n=1 Tax=Saitoella complicata (strain BCRC 22490 / CBS 7301 / JCM 7358 / NBRC 10748 / NRRL Y-17804) TaxID=698492 RepID=A0A0E9NR17_SAICN|nr:uncharacterized protein SAICODRAFT_29781 [Saitoella complicata NRRL Y-17804]ODQ54286.1 hypothetical protein SAICODRAFT_29781 [Saitoella complicata NRRL Y-17804]GAO52243.1 hypothetical protein G7K_6324-t1 [Saitoella complicata NRRL Y-17804]
MLAMPPLLRYGLCGKSSALVDSYLSPLFSSSSPPPGSYRCVRRLLSSFPALWFSSRRGLMTPLGVSCQGHAPSCVLIFIATLHSFPRDVATNGHVVKPDHLVATVDFSSLTSQDI